MTPVQTAAEVLNAARGIILERGWGPFDDNAGVSIYYAVALAVLDRALGARGPLESEAAWHVAVYGVCGFVETFLPRDRYAGIVDWEMRDGRSGDEVLALLDKAILAAELALEPARAA